MSGIAVCVCGGRNYSDTLEIATTLGRIHDECGIAVLIEGGATGADFYARRWALVRGIGIMQFRAEWEKYGRAAGPRRNRRMLTEGKPDLVVAFPGGRGTADCVRQARELGIEVLEAL